MNAAVTSGDAIVVAEIVERRSPRGCAGGHVRATIDVTEVIAGPGQLGEQVVQTQVSGASCGLDLAEGETWVLQVYGDESWVGLCTIARRIEGPDDAWVVQVREAAAAATE